MPSWFHADPPRRTWHTVSTRTWDKFIRAVNARTKRTVGADYELQDGDVIRIVANK